MIKYHYIIFTIISIRIFTLNLQYAGLNLLAPAFLGLFFLLSVFKNSTLSIRALSNKMMMLNYLILCLFFISSIIGWMNGFELSISLSFLLKYVVILFLCYFGFIAASRGYKASLFYFILILNICNFFALLSYFGLGKNEVVNNIVRPIGIVGYSEVMSHISLFSLLFYFYLQSCEKWILQGTYRIIVAFSLILALVTLLLSSTLKNILVLPVGVFFILFFSGFGFSRLLKVTLLGAIIASPIIVYYGADLFIRLDKVVTAGIDLDIKKGDMVQSTFMFRVLHWKLLLTDWYNNYFYLGAGVGNVPFMKGFGYERGFKLDAHGDIVKFICELGVVGGAIFALIYYKFIRLLFSELPFSTLSVFCLSVILTFTIVGVAGKVFYSAYNLYFLSFLVGLSFGVSDSSRKRRQV